MADYVGTEAVAERLGLSETRVRQLVSQGVLPGRRLVARGQWRFRWSEVEAAMRGDRQEQTDGVAVQ